MKNLQRNKSRSYGWREELPLKLLWKISNDVFFWGGGGFGGQAELTLRARPPDTPLGAVMDEVVKEPQPMAGEMKLLTNALSEPFESTEIYV